MASISDIDWIVISLRRTPQRLEQFSAANGHLDVRFEVLDAVDGLSLDRDELSRSGLVDAGMSWSPGAIGAALSHRMCWLRAAESGRPVCIFEDDAVLRNDFAGSAIATIESLPLDWDILHFGFNVDSLLGVQLGPGLEANGDFDLKYLTPADLDRFAASTGPALPFKLNNVFGTCAYAVSPAGAQKLLDGCFPLASRLVIVNSHRTSIWAQTADVLMNALYGDIGAYVCLPPIAMPINDKASSTVVR